MQSHSSTPVMGRKKLALKKIENSTARQVTYSKRKDGMIKKAHELAVLCDTDIAVVMFSPSGRLTTFSSSRRFISLMQLLNFIFKCLSSFNLLLLVVFLKITLPWLCRVEDIFLRFLCRPDELKGGCVLLSILN